VITLALTVLGWIWSKIGKWIVMAGAVLCAIGLFALRFYDKGEAEQKSKQIKVMNHIVTVTHQSDANVDKMSDAQVDAAITKLDR
jgi:predicted negative regulator of RcsB-dependent stress response